MKMTKILLKEANLKKATKQELLQQENEQLSNEVRDLKAELAKIHAYNFEPEKVIANELKTSDLAKNILKTNNEKLAPQFEIKSATKSYFINLTSYLKDRIKPGLEYSSKLRLPLLFSYLRIALKIYALFYFITGSLLFFSLNYDLVDHTLFLVKSYDYIIDKFKSVIVNSFDFVMRFIESIFSNKSETNQGPIWPDLDKYQARRKELEKAQQIYDEYKQNKTSFTDSTITSETSNWYDFYKSPLFYVPVTMVIGFLIYSNFDSISDWFGRGRPDAGNAPGNNPGPGLNPTTQASNSGVRYLTRDQAIELSRRMRAMEANQVASSSTSQQSTPFLGLSSKYSVNNVQVTNPVDIELLDLRPPVSPSGSTESVETITQSRFNKIKND